ncbi:Uncharacterized conserved protein, DUF427 family [Bauldia litoralis]|uniref:Uncharacterized conserved protein, DUF427 family n=2 Tax=Bauldia litoralis TaxID=665467 RepID=A0A1G6AG56_9HYPH|nr:Uncharacterized conserved protein, DUF427 family [Bauldia litoralis]
MLTTSVTLVRDTGHHPAEPRPFMKIKPVDHRVRILRDGFTIGDSTDAVRPLEVGTGFDAPVFYLPKADATPRLAPSNRTSHCSLKGEAPALDLRDESGRVIVTDIAWGCTAPHDFASALSDRVGFLAGEVTAEEMAQ